MLPSRNVHQTDFFHQKFFMRPSIIKPFIEELNISMMEKVYGQNFSLNCHQHECDSVNRLIDWIYVSGTVILSDFLSFYNFLIDVFILTPKKSNFSSVDKRQYYVFGGLLSLVTTRCSFTYAKIW